MFGVEGGAPPRWSPARRPGGRTSVSQRWAQPPAGAWTEDADGGFAVGWLIDSMILPQVHLRNGERLLADPDPSLGGPDYILGRRRACAPATHRHLVCERHPGTGGRRRSGWGLGCRWPTSGAVGASPPLSARSCSRRCYHTQGRYPGHGRLLGEPLGGRERCGRPRNLTVSPGGRAHCPAPPTSSFGPLLGESRRAPFRAAEASVDGAGGTTENLVTTSPSSRWEGLTNFSATDSVAAGGRQSKRFTSTSNR